MHLFTRMFICIFPARPMGACDFYLNCSGFLEYNFFSLSLRVFGGQLDDLYKSCFLGRDFALLG